LDEIDVISSGDDNNLKELMKFGKQAEIQEVCICKKCNDKK
jgi:hypothetical protein